MTHRAEYHIDGIIYVPREDTNENKSIMETVAKYLPVWLKNEKAQKRYLVLGELREQVQQFHQFRKDFASGMIYKRPFKIGEFPPGVTTELIGAMNHAQPQIRTHTIREAGNMSPHAL